MKRRTTDTLLTLVQSFFAEHLRLVQGASDHTVRAYRDALRLFLVFLADHVGRSVADLRRKTSEPSSFSAFFSTSSPSAATAL